MKFLRSCDEKQENLNLCYPEFYYKHSNCFSTSQSSIMRNTSKVHWSLNYSLRSYSRATLIETCWILYMNLSWNQQSKAYQNICLPWGCKESDMTERLHFDLFHFHALGKETATHSSVLAWRIPGTGEPVGLPSMGSHRVGHDWSDLAAAAGTGVRRWKEIKVSKVLFPSTAILRNRYSLCEGCSKCHFFLPWSVLWPFQRQLPSLGISHPYIVPLTYAIPTPAGLLQLPL